VATDKRFVGIDGNLNATTSWSPSGLPIAGDSWFFDGSSKYDVSSGLQAFAAIEPAKIRIQSPYEGNIGADGNFLRVPVRRLIHQGSGSLFYEYVLVFNFDSYILIDSPNLQDAFTFYNPASPSNVRMLIRRGRAKLLDAGGSIAQLIVCSRDGLGPFVTIGANYGAVAYYHQTSGEVTTKSDLGISTGDCIVDGGTLIYDAASTDAWNRIVVAGGRVIYNGTGTLTECIIDSGTLDMTQDSRAKTISALTIMPGSNFYTHENISVTKLIDLRENIPTLP
jgi:hypothetical protein